MIAIFLILLLGAGVEFRFALMFLLPVVAGFVVSGWLVTGWIAHLILLLAGIVYAFVMLRLLS